MKRILGELAFAAGLGVTIWLALHLGLRPVGQALGVIGVGGVLLVAVAHLPTLAVLGLSWRQLAHPASGSHPAKFVWGRLMRDAGGELLPFSQIGGYALGARALALTGVSGVEAAVSSLLDLVVEQLAKVPYAAAAVALLVWLAPGSLLVGPALGLLAFTLGLVALMVLRRDWVRARMVRMAANLDRRWPGLGATDRRGAEAAMAEALAPHARIGWSLSLHLVGWTLGAFEAWIALRLLGAEITPAEAVVIDGLFVAFRIFAFAIPAAIGVQEGAFVVLCGLFGVEAPTALAFSLVRRARDLIVGTPAVLAWQFLEHRRRNARQGSAA